jgi:hypothetical protein
MSTEWITDRLPTAEDALTGWWVWTMHNGKTILWSYDGIALGDPWQPIHVPAPYVKPKRWRLRWNAHAYQWNIVNNYDGLFVATLQLDADALSTAQRICDIFNEVMP